MSVRTTTLRNGVRVVTQHMPHLETVSLGIWVGVGSRHEGEHENGISHLLEHMAFKGTERRSALAIAEEIESVGGELNAATSMENTAYYARVLKDDVPLALDILSDILIGSTFDGGELAREKSVVLQEIAAAQDCPDDVAYDLVQEAAFPAQALGRSILGTARSIRSLTPDSLRGYLARHYRGRGLVLSAAGAVDHDALSALAEELLGALPGNDAPAPETSCHIGGVRHARKPCEQSHIVLAFKAPSYRDETYYVGQVLSGLLGDGMSSRLFQEARERRGLCYSIYSYCWGLSDAGLFGVHAATGPEQADELVAVMAAEMHRAADELPSAKEIARAKAQLKAGLLMSLESSSARAEQMARQTMAFGRPLTVSELTARVESVTGDAVRAYAERLLTGAPPGFASVGPRGSLAKARDLAGKFARQAVRAAE